jgi:hypothetical protein
MTERDRVGGFVRKPYKWAEVGLPVAASFLAELKQYTSSELGIQHNIGADFRIPIEDDIILVGHEGGLYMIDTGGVGEHGDAYARYVRYVGCVVEKPVPDTRAYVAKVLTDSGYFCEPGSVPPGPDERDLKTATFAGINEIGQEVYDITFINEEDTTDFGKVYIWVDPATGRKKADF